MLLVSEEKCGCAHEMENIAEIAKFLLLIILYSKQKGIVH